MREKETHEEDLLITDLEKEHVTTRSFFKHVARVSVVSTFVTIAFLTTLGWLLKSEIVSLFLPTFQRELAQRDTVPVVMQNGENATLQLVSEKSIGRKELSVEEAVNKADPAVVAISVSKIVPKYEQYSQQLDPFGFFFVPQLRQNGAEKQVVGGGSGFFVSRDGLIATNKHVVSDINAEFSVKTKEGKTYTAVVVARDPVLDIALIKIEGNNFPTLELGDSSTLKLGQSVIAIGNALAEFQNSVSVGVISGLSRSVTAGNNAGVFEQLDELIQTDTAINPGNSGGPLLNLYGEVIGVNVAVAQGSQNIGFALPINVVKSAIESVKNTGKIVRPFVGIHYVQITASIQKQNNLSVDYGIWVKGPAKGVSGVVAGSPAQLAGIQDGDIILSIDGEKITEARSFSYIIRQKNIGQKVIFTVLSGGVQKNVTLTLTAAPESI